VECDADTRGGELSPTDSVITVALDRLSLAALAVLTADGTEPTEAVRTAIIDAAERVAEPEVPSQKPSGASQSFEDHVAESVAAAPPLSAYQRYVLSEVFIEGHETWLSEAQWTALRDRSASDGE